MPHPADRCGLARWAAIATQRWPNAALGEPLLACHQGIGGQLARLVLVSQVQGNLSERHEGRTVHIRPRHIVAGTLDTLSGVPPTPCRITQDTLSALSNKEGIKGSKARRPS